MLLKKYLFTLTLPLLLAIFFMQRGNAMISAQGLQVTPPVRSAKMLPRGAALLTHSGKLAGKGIKHIIHAASGSMTKSGTDFNPTAKGVADSITNSLILAKKAGHKKVAIPFIGGGIFLRAMGMTKSQLAALIITTANAYTSDIKVVLVAYGAEDTQVFKDELKKMKTSNKNLSLVSGSLIDYSVHQASAIVNPANMEVTFGGGLSGIIGNASGASSEINNEAHATIKAFHQQAQK